MSDTVDTFTNTDVKLMHYTRFSGCGAKLGPGLLEKALCGLEQPAYPELLADFSGSEDAGVFKLTDDTALVQTVDFFPPIVNDPFLFGRIAAANALSDVYAMGGKPLTALALVCFPVKKLELDVLKAMMAGGLDALIEAGCALLGGHSVEDPEPKLGYAVTGLVRPDEVWRNNTLVPGLALILTKPIGTGLINMAVRAEMASERAKSAAEASMATLNAKAAQILKGFHVAACTDVTGFGLAGHAAEMASGTTCGLSLNFDAIPLLPDVAEYAAMGLVPDGARRNRDGRGQALRGAENFSPEEIDILFDPQTSGGLLAALPQAEASAALDALQAAGVMAAIVGHSGGAPGTVELGRGAARR
ncbi:MAG TPA: selenide, water dikinase SelD [Spirochaetales bacterium]|nr:selenide, water dikinase SelD [Spirochaetales bacterium]